MTAALLCLGALLAMFAGCGRAPSAVQDPEASANAFFAALETGDPHAAYDSAAFGFQVAQSFDAFLSNARELGLVGGQPPAWTRKQITGTETRLDGTIVSQYGKPLRISVSLTPDGLAWKLFSLQTSTGQETTEDRFTLVGKGSDFNDVYHQPMPGRDQLETLVHKTMADFSSAIRQGDFHGFYNSVSQQWKNGYRTSGAVAAGVTERMLKDHFQGFIDKKIDLSMLAGLPPVFDRAPLINQDGFLNLNGHFDTPQYRIDFFLQYAYELPRWRLFGIDVEITK